MCRGGKNIRLGSGYEKIKYGSSSGWSVLKTKTTETFCFKNIVSFNYQGQSLLKQRQDDLFAWFVAAGGLEPHADDSPNAQASSGPQHNNNSKMYVIN